MQPGHGIIDNRSCSISYGSSYVILFRYTGIVCAVFGIICMIAAALGPHIGLGDAYDFLAYRLFSMSRMRFLRFGLKALVLGACVAGIFWTDRRGMLFLDFISHTSCRFYHATRNLIVRWRNAPPRWLSALERGLALSPDVANPDVAGHETGWSPGPFHRLLSVSQITVLVALIALLFFSFFHGFDITDEGRFLYDISHEDSVSGFFIDFIAGRLGIVFQNNIIVWRCLGLILLLAGGGVFATGLSRFSGCLGLAATGKEPRTAAIVAVLAGVLAFYAYGYPILSYRLASSFGVLLAFGALMHALCASVPGRQWPWVALASFGAVIMVAGRISAGPMYPVAGILLLCLAMRLKGWRKTFELLGLHILFCLIWVAVLTFGLRLERQFAGTLDLLLWQGTAKGYTLFDILAFDMPQFQAAITQAAMLSGPVLAVAAATGLALELPRRFFRCRFSPFQVFGAGVLGLAALLPALIAADYLLQWESFFRAVAAGCPGGDMITCQNPTPAEDGRIFLRVAGAQMICVLVLVILDRVIELIRPRPQNTAPKNLLSWGLLIGFLFISTYVSSFYTNVGWLYHSILSLGPLTAMVFVAMAMIPLRNIVISKTVLACSARIATGLFLISTCLISVHNRHMFIHRVDGLASEQTFLLNEPPQLRGLRVTPRTGQMFSNLRSTLAAAEFDAGQDILVLIYNIPGLAIVTGARTLGSAWMVAGYPDIDKMNCFLVQRDTIDLSRIRRVFMVSFMPLNPVLESCLTERGLDFSRRTALPGLKVDDTRILNIFAIPLRK